MTAAGGAADRRLVRKLGWTFAVATTARYREFWDWFETGDWEPDAVAAFERFVRPGSVCLDLGAWIGRTALLAASAGAR